MTPHQYLMIHAPSLALDSYSFKQQLLDTMWGYFRKYGEQGYSIGLSKYKNDSWEDFLAGSRFEGDNVPS